MTTTMCEPPEKAGMLPPPTGARVKCLISGVSRSMALTSTAKVCSSLTAPRASYEHVLDGRQFAGRFGIRHHAHVGREAARIMIAHQEPALAARAADDIRAHVLGGGAAVNAVHPPCQAPQLFGADLILVQVVLERDFHCEPDEAFRPRHIEPRAHERVREQRLEFAEKRCDVGECAHLLQG